MALKALKCLLTCRGLNFLLLTIINYSWKLLCKHHPRVCWTSKGKCSNFAKVWKKAQTVIFSSKLVWMVRNNRWICTSIKAQDCYKLEKAGPLSTVKQVLYHHWQRDCCPGNKPLCQTIHLQTWLQFAAVDKERAFWRMVALRIRSLCTKIHCINY